MDRLHTTLLWTSALGAILTAGVFFAFSSFIMRGLQRLPAGQGAAAMNSINMTVINPLFMAVFLGTGLVCATLAAMSLPALPSRGALKILAAAAAYIIGSIGVTMVFNVPLNNALALGQGDSAALWAHYVKTWTAWNSVRGLASLAAGALMISALAS
jgi:uncharacterized membrane protein